MNIFAETFNIVLYQPLFNALILLYQWLPNHDFGIAVIALTVLIRIIFYPLGAKAIISQKSLQDLQPKIQEIQKKYKENKEELARATIELYQKAKVNPFSGCLPLLIQLPILVALYQVFWKGFQPEQMNFLYSFVAHPTEINPYFLGLINLSKPNIYFAILAGLAQFFQTKMTSSSSFQSQGKKTKEGVDVQISEMMQKQMLYFFPIFTMMILWTIPSAIALYWTVSSLFSIAQQYLIFKKIKY